jgi:hypothetical protein
LRKEWLEDYLAQEDNEYHTFVQNYKGGKIEYPSKNRFKKLRNPLADTTSNIWTIIPFYGSSIIHIHPLAQESLVNNLGWGSDRDINNLIQLSKDTGRVQFVLDKSPLDYEPYDYLEPVLKELHPPMIKLVPSLVFDNNLKMQRLSSARRQNIGFHGG